MRTLTDDRYAPVTEAFGFLDAPMGQVAEFVRDWRQRLGHEVSTYSIDDSFPESLRRLEPLTVATQVRELFLRTTGTWTAYFVNGAPAPDPWSPTMVIAKGLECRALVVGCASMAAPSGEPARVPANVRMDLLGPESQSILYSVRGIQVAWDGSRYVFVASGQAQPFEEPSRYLARRVVDRFTPELLDRYAQALGIRIFDQSFYDHTGILVEHSVRYAHESYTIEEAQARWGLGALGQPSRVAPVVRADQHNDVPRSSRRAHRCC